MDVAQEVNEFPELSPIELHGFVAAKNNLCHLFIGASGQGKSTLAAHSLAEGLRITGDERVQIFSNGSFRSIEANLSLSEKSLQAIQLNHPGAEEGKVRFQVPREFIKLRGRLSHIYVLNSHQGSITQKRLSPVNGVAALISNLFLKEDRPNRQTLSTVFDLTTQFPIDLINLPHKSKIQIQFLKKIFAEH